MITLLAFMAAFFFAINIGASGAAASMGIAYGSGAVKTRRIALLICAAGVFLGAAIGGGEVAKTLGSGIIPKELISINISLIILSSAAISLFIANIAGIPLSTSEVTVGAIVGVGIAYKKVFLGTLLSIVMYWILIPIVAFILAVMLNKIVKKAENRFLFLKEKKWVKILSILVVCTGFLEAFSAGMNNVANSIGPLAASGLISIQHGIIVGGLFVATGAMVLGGRVVETNGKKITELSLLQGSAVSGIGAALVIIASVFGIPVPQTQVTTCSILGVGFSNKGWKIFGKGIISRLLKVWLVSPLFSLVVSYNLVKLFLDFDIYAVAIGVSVFIATTGSISLINPIGFTRTPYLKEGTKVKKEGGR